MKLGDNMHQLTINVNESFYPHFKALIDSLVKSKQLNYVETKEDKKQFFDQIILNSVEEVKRKVQEAEDRVHAGSYVEEDVFWKNIDKNIGKYAN